MHTAIVRGWPPFASFATWATTDAEPVPVPPPRPRVMKTMSESGERLLELVLGFVGRRFPDLREGARPETAGQSPAEEDLLRSVNRQQVLGVGVAGDHVGAGEALFREAVDGVAATSPAADDLDVGLEGRQHRLELGVIVRRRRKRFGAAFVVSGKMGEDFLGEWSHQGEYPAAEARPAL